jgi:hypothetical protein
MTASVTPTPSVTPSVTFTPTMTMTPSVTFTPTLTPSVTPTQTLPLVTIAATGSVTAFASNIGYKFYTSEGSTGANQATVYGTFNSANFNVPNLPSNGSNINVTFYVDRIAPDGIADDVGYVIWYKDGNQVNQANFNTDDQVQKSYTMSINKDSVVVVTVLEG